MALFRYITFIRKIFLRCKIPELPAPSYPHISELPAADNSVLIIGLSYPTAGNSVDNIVPSCPHADNSE